MNAWSEMMNQREQLVMQTSELVWTLNCERLSLTSAC